MTSPKLAATTALSLVLFAPVAQAQCAVTGTTGTCSGAITDPVDLDIDGLDLTNAGDIDVSTDDAVRLRGDDNTLTNSGTITATDSSDEGVQADGANFTLVNSGTITAADKGVQAEEPGTTITNSGTIVSGDEGIEAGASVDIVNSGTVRAAEDGVQYGDGSFTNTETGVVEGGSSGDGDAIDIDFGSVLNNGTLRALGAGSAGIDVDEETVDGDPVTERLTITNTGLIEGPLGILVEPVGPGGIGLNESVQHVVNSGTLRGTDGIAASLAAGDDIFEILAGTVIEGDVLLGAGRDTLIFGSGVGPLSGGLFDGGEGIDRLVLPGGLTPATVSFTPANSFDVSWSESGVATSFVIDNVEWVTFEVEGTFAIATDGTLAPVPLPAGLPMLAAAAGLLALLRRRAGVS